MKRPKWTDYGVGFDDTMEEEIAALNAIATAAKALRIEAKFWRQQKNRDAAWAIEKVAGYLDQVAAGKTWAQAFDWPAVDDGKKEW
jgi:hypothetical protein